jgi:hypothetical protein
LFPLGTLTTFFSIELKEKNQKSTKNIAASLAAFAA